MAYPESGTTTRVTGRVETPDKGGEPTAIAWEELECESRGSRSIQFNGQDKARILDTAMNGAWYYDGSQQVVAKFEMEALDA